jgi:hypothetical protein
MLHSTHTQPVEFDLADPTITAMHRRLDALRVDARVLHLTPGELMDATLTETGDCDHHCMAPGDPSGLRFVSETFDAALCDAERVPPGDPAPWRALARLLRPGASVMVRATTRRLDDVRALLLAEGFFVAAGSAEGDTRLLIGVRGERPARIRACQPF